MIIGAITKSYDGDPSCQIGLTSIIIYHKLIPDTKINLTRRINSSETKTLPYALMFTKNPRKNLPQAAKK